MANPPQGLHSKCSPNQLAQKIGSHVLDAPAAFIFYRTRFEFLAFCHPHPDGMAHASACTLTDH
jgi:hypothetical protein